MSYLHCHTKNCGWSQDDFWSKNYNPIKLFFTYDLVYYAKPRILKFDTSVMRELKWKKKNRFSWWMIGWEFKRMIKKIVHQKWWTYESWLKVKDKAICPKCGKHNFDID